MQARSSGPSSGTLLLVGAGLALVAGLVYLHGDDEWRGTYAGWGTGDGIADEQLAAPRPFAGVERTLLLHGISAGDPPMAWISMEGVPQRAVRVGDAIRKDMRVVAISGNNVVVNMNGRQLVLTIDPRSGQPGDRRGLDPEPVTMPQLSGAEIVRRQAAAQQTQ